MRQILHHFHISHLIFILLIAIGILIPEQTASVLDDITYTFGTQLSWMILLIFSFFIGFAFVLGFGRFGHVTLGSPKDAPEFSFLSWIAMLFAAGMGTGLVFHGAAEPLYHFTNPPPRANAVVEEDIAARYAMVVTFFHWGIHAWAVYAVAAVTIAYATFRKGLPMLPSSALMMDMSKRSRRIIALTVNTLASIAVVTGLVSSLGYGVVQMSAGIAEHSALSLGSLSDADMLHLKLGVLFVLVVSYIASSITGIGKGIKILSNVNMLVAITLALFVVYFGPTLFIFQSFVSGIGDYLDRFIKLAFNVRQYSDSEGWQSDWTISYLLWWVAWGPFVGVFIARISKGRTIREFMLAVIFVPSIFSFFWFASLGGAALHIEIFEQSGLAAIATSDLSKVTFALMEYFPYPALSGAIILGLIFIFLVTSADSGSYVLAMFSSDGQTRPPRNHRLIWGSIIALVTAAALMMGRELPFIRSFAVAGSIPYLFIMVAQCVVLWRSLQADFPEKKRL